ncbi:ABC transporter permease [Agrococcus versicolor]|uniref:ABC transporter permease n=1 Tax=Agrococcus versicolor TaxID=501482 RepID=A0ABP5MR47_9MICO
MTTTAPPQQRATLPPAPRRRLRLPGFLMALPAWSWLLVFFVAPVGLVIYYSFGYKPGLFATHATDVLSFDRYLEALSPTFASVFLNTLWVGVIGTILCLLIAMPAAYWIATKVPANRRGLMLGLVLVPFWTNFLVRTIGWRVMLAPEGFLSEWMVGLGLGPIEILNTRLAVLIGVVYNYLPLMILPLYVAFDRVEGPLREASKDLGADRVRTFLTVTLPLARPGIIAGVLFVYIPLMGDYITATVLGGAQGTMAGQLVASQFTTAQNWALGSAMAVVLILTTVLSAVAAAAMLWLVTWPLRLANRMRIGEAS